MPDSTDRQPEKPTQCGLFDRLSRRLFIFGLALLGICLFLWSFATLRMLFPNTSRRRKGWITLGPIDEFLAGGVDERFKESFGLYIVDMRIDGVRQLFALSAFCTHLACMTRWEKTPRIFICPCHSSSFTESGINIKGPAPRPLPRLAIRLDASRRVQVDPSRRFHAKRNQWNDPECCILPDADEVTNESTERSTEPTTDGAKE